MPINKKDSPSTFRTHEGKRIVTISYVYNKETKELRYGGAIFRKDKPTDTFIKKAHTATSLSRLTKKPVIVENVEDTAKIEDFRRRVRDYVHTYGVCKTTKRVSVNDQSVDESNTNSESSTTVGEHQNEAVAVNN